MSANRPIAIVVPNERSRAATERVFEEQLKRREVLISVIGPDGIRTGYQRLRDQGAGMILARGGTYEEFSRLGGDIPLFLMEITMLDILELLKAAEESGLYRRVYLLLHERVRFDAALCRRFLHIPVEYRSYFSIADIYNLLAELDPEPGSLIVGSGFVSTLWEKTDIPTWDILLKPETLLNYYYQAVSIVEQMAREAENLTQLQAVISQIGEGIVVIDHKGNVCNINRRGQELLGMQDYTPMGLNIWEAMKDFPFAALLGKECPYPKRKLLLLQGVTVSITIVSYAALHGGLRYLLTLQPAGEIQKLEHDIRYKLAQRGLTARHTFDDILTCDPKMKQMIERAKRIADAEGSVLIYGESGTGKELFAQSIHQYSARSDGPFVAVNCAALNESLLESELFGYVGGAFTGARKEGKSGLFELAHKGTLFLDEINSMSLNLQAKLLRVLEEHRVMRLGSDYVIPLDIRIIAAANQNLTEHIHNGHFRADLYYRLSTFTLNIPPLDKRPGDIELLFRSFVAQQIRTPPAQIALDPKFKAELNAHHWPGNVRELRNAALRYVVYHGENQDGEIFSEDIAESAVSLVSPQGKIDLDELGHTVEDLVIQSLLEQGLSKNDVAEMLGISRQALYQKRKRFKAAQT